MPSVVMLVVLLLLMADRLEGVPRDQLIQLSCNNLTIGNQTVFSQNFIQTTEKIGAQVQSSLFGSGNTGMPPDEIFGLIQCFGDLSTSDCIICYDAAHFSISRCFPHTGAILYQDGCFMRFQNYSFYDEYSGPSDTRICGNTTKKGSVFESSARQAVSIAMRDALVNVDYFAREEVLSTRGVNESVYVLANCWKTLNASSCRSCLEDASASILQCLPWSEGRVLNAGCFMRYSDTNFLNPVPVRSRSSNQGRMIAVIAAVVSAMVIFIVALLVLLYIRRRRWLQKKRAGSNDAKKMAKILTDSSLNFKYSTIEKATGSWDETNKLGEGGFGTVYKGVLPDGREIAVKRLFINNKFRAADFYNEVNMISSVEHKNLVRLLGCNCSGPESFLVYEFLPNMSLDRFIFDAMKGKELNWEKRFEIIIGTTEGLVYLHENTKNRIIHRDIKAPNILLDSRLRAKIADFGLARSFQEDMTHISTAIAGTLGYMAPPEYLALGQLTEKADVYSYGVLLLEIVSGAQNNKSKNSEYSDSLVAIAWRHFQLGTVEEILDPNLMFHTYPKRNFKKEAIKVVHVGLLCTQEDPSLRPSISTALRMLVKDDEPLPPPSNPPFVDDIEISELEAKIQRYHDDDDTHSVATVSHSQFSPRKREEGESSESKVNFVWEKEHVYKDDKNEIQEMGSESE
uniref:Cysteine-rich receptor-like protein kinase 2 n=1 Tax=Tanacetum cinerariifolium TaxID=118510 RepID=A0A6L2KFU8_TANCI|nr:cysteine-rich receptor-like protein kinase 2 [Tanacetum cinerariifolium]